MSFPRALAALAVAFAFFVLAPAAGAAVGTPLTGEFVPTWEPATLTGGLCDTSAESSFTFEHSGQATGPYPGAYHETGRIKLSPMTEPIPGAPGQYRSHIIEFEASFTITGPNGTVTGTKSLAPGQEVNNLGGCLQGISAGQFIASSLTYEATVTPAGGEAFSDHGYAWDNFNAYGYACGCSSSSYQYRAGFTSSGPVVPTDSTPPQLTVPDSITREAGDATAVTYDVSATDDTDANPAVSCDPASGSTFPLGTTTVTCTATDTAGNKTEKTFDVTVAKPADTTGPELTVPESITRESRDATAVTYDVSATDDTDGQLPVTCAPASGSTFPLGTTTVTCTATDAAGNKTEKSFDVTVAEPADTTPPEITVPDPITRDADGPSGATVSYDVSATDDTDGQLPVTCDPASGSTFAIGTTTVTCTATDAAGNKRTRSFPVEITGPEDSDGDGLSDVIEIMLGCNPHKADTDDDGINDYLEILLETDPTKSNSNPDDPDHGDDGSYLHKIYGHRCGCGPEDDADGDGVATWIELKWGTNPGSRVSYDPGSGYSSEIDYVWHRCGCKPYAEEGGGGVPTMVKKRWHTGSTLTIIKRCGCHPWEDPHHHGGIWRSFRIVTGAGSDTDDPDGDGLDTLVEEWLGCNPHQKDTDGDGLDDGREIELGTNPLDVDTDGDGMNDRREVELGCNPLKRDTDDDGVEDGADNCPLVANPDQKDIDHDGKGDACDDDRDGDGVLNSTDDCPEVANADQKDSDGDGKGDRCDDTPYLLGDTVFNDANRNGKQDAGENGIAGVTVERLDTSGKVVATTRTGADGRYLFQVANGTHRTRVAAASLASNGPLANARSTTGGNDQAKTVNGASVMTSDYGYLFNTPPTCTTTKVDQPGLWPPNHKFVTVTLSGARDADGDPLTWKINGVTQDEGLSDVADAALAAQPNQIQVRAERLGTGDGRVYTVAYTVSDGFGGSCSGTVTVSVPHDMGGTAKASVVKVDSFGKK